MEEKDKKKDTEAEKEIVKKIQIKEIIQEDRGHFEKAHFTLEPKTTKPYDIEKMTGKKSGKKDDKEE